MSSDRGPVHVQTIVVGGGQAGLVLGYHLSRRGLPFVILDASRRVGDAWRNRWDSLRLFTPARYAGLSGLPFPARGDAHPTKDQMADYLLDVERVSLRSMLDGSKNRGIDLAPAQQIPNQLVGLPAR